MITFMHYFRMPIAHFICGRCRNLGRRPLLAPTNKEKPGKQDGRIPLGMFVTFKVRNTVIFANWKGNCYTSSEKDITCGQNKSRFQKVINVQFIGSRKDFSAGTVGCFFINVVRQQD